MKPVLALLLLTLSLGLQAGPLTPEAAPAPLQPWADWVLFDHPEAGCPFLYSSADHRCLWPGALFLQIEGEAASFSQDWQSYRDAWLPLPGSDRHWPEAVRLNDVEATVISRDSGPAVWAEAGRHRVSGRIPWSRLPETLHLPAMAGLVRVMQDGEAVEQPLIDDAHRLWLTPKPGGRDAAPEQSLGLQVFRRVIDGHPLRVATRLQIEAAGEQRELVLPPPLLPGATPLRLDSPLPARLQPDGGLRVQLRPGRWTLEVTGRHRGPVEALGLESRPPPWPAEEVWVFEADRPLRLTEVEGPQQVAPRQTNLPAEWQRFPAYRMTPGQTFALRVIRRGNPEPEPDRLRLKRTLWLDFDGAGYTVQDRISGSLNRQWRLEADPELALGQAVVDGQPQFITRLPETERAGIEVRHGDLDLVADGRLEGSPTDLPALGWTTGFEQVAHRLRLPPGWRLFHAEGADNRPAGWLQQWTLLDLFLVLVAAIAAARLWGLPWGLFALAALTLSWQEPAAPRFVWLNLLAAIALLRLLPAGRMRQAVGFYRNLTLLALALIVLPFMIQQVRLGLFPQLERPYQNLGAEQAHYPVQTESGFGQPRKDEAPPLAQSRAPAPMPKVASGKAYDYLSGKRPALQQIDPAANIQTGPGLPQWSWREIALNWNGPVQPDQRVRLWLIDPLWNLLLKLAAAVLVLILGLRMLDRRLPRPGAERAATLAAAPLIGLGLLGLPAQDAMAETTAEGFPPAHLLQQLQERLTRPAQCLPQCAEIPRLAIHATPEELTLRLEIHAAETVAVPLPWDPAQWTPHQVRTEGGAETPVLGGNDADRWVVAPAGRSLFILAGAAPAGERLALPLPLRPKRVDTQLQGWAIEGLRPDGTPEGQLHLTRERLAAEPATETLEPAALPPLVAVERTLHLDLDWRVETRVRRLSPAGSPISLRLPLLPGESVISARPRTQADEALVQIGPEQQELRWESALEVRERIVLSAADHPNVVETWRLSVSPLWHVSLDGIPPVQHQGHGEQRLPEWKPWPGERVGITVIRPQGVDGPTLTLDRSLLQVKPGKRATDLRLEMHLRSSQGDRHRIQLPPEADLQAVTIDDKRQPVRLEGGGLTLPIVPGAQQIAIDWQQPVGIQTRFTTPALDLGLDGVNHQLQVRLGRDRWVLLTGGPAIGPAVLFWGVLLVILLAALALARIRFTPLRTHHWLLLGIGLSQAPAAVAILVAGWLIALGARGQIEFGLSAGRFNAIQIGLALLTLIALGGLVWAVKHGLLGLPAMQIAGNGSSAYALNWYQDRTGPVPPQAWVLSAPLWFYRLLMLAWALWLAFALLRWLKWGWTCYSTHGLWRRIELKRPRRGVRSETPTDEK